MVEMLVTRPASESGRAPFGPDGCYAPDAEIGSGDILTMWVDSDDAVTSLFHDHDTEGSTRSLGRRPAGGRRYYRPIPPQISSLITGGCRKQASEAA